MKLFGATLGTVEDVIEQEYNAKMAKKILKKQMSERQALFPYFKKYEKGVDQEELERMMARQKRSMESLKKICAHESSNMVKWQIGIRFNGYRSNGEKQQCICKEATQNQEHIMTCDRFQRTWLEIRHLIKSAGLDMTVH